MWCGYILSWVSITSAPWAQPSGQATSRAADLDELQLRYSILVSRIDLLKDYRYANLFPNKAWYQQQIGKLVWLVRQTDQRLNAHDDHFDQAQATALLNELDNVVENIRELTIGANSQLTDAANASNQSLQELNTMVAITAALLMLVAALIAALAWRNLSHSEKRPRKPRRSAASWTARWNRPRPPMSPRARFWPI
jgi:hypothetical protein